MHSFYFGTTQKPLFGVYHAPEGRGAAPRGIVLCNPFGHEYIRAHRAFRNLAMALSKNGFHVLRFDYYGSGDSGGEGESGGIAQSACDLSNAIDELKDMAGVRRVSLVGLRLGAALAALAAAERSDLDDLVLWDPVLSGRKYITDLEEVQREWLRTRPQLTMPRGRITTPELIGFPLTLAMRRQYEALDLTTVRQLRAKRLVVVISSEQDRDPLDVYVRAVNAPAEIHVVPSAGDWYRPEAVHLTLLPHEIVQAIVGFLTTGAL